MSSLAAPTFEEQITESFQELRRSLGSLLNACGTRLTQPQQMARDLDVSRNLTWKISKVLCSHDLYDAMQHLPGDEGVEIMIRAAGNKGVDGLLAKDVRESLAEFNRVVEYHSGDRATLELMLESWGGATERLEQSRKLAYRGNCGIWGIQARVRIHVVMVAPNLTKPELLDLTQLGGVVDFRRLRPNVRWPLFRPRIYHDSGEPMVHGPREEAIDPAYMNASGPKLVGPFCSVNMPPINLVHEQRGAAYELAEGPVGNTGAFDCMFGTHMRAIANRYRAPGDEFGEMSAQITLPVEWMQSDFLIHRDLDIPLSDMETTLLGQMLGLEPGHRGMAIPFSERPAELSGQPPALSSALFDRYEDMMAYVLERVGRSARDFRAYRLLVRYPPMHSIVKVRFPLPEQP